MSQTHEDTIRATVQEYYAGRARSTDSCCNEGADCDSERLYDKRLLADLPEDVSAFSLGCGDSVSLARLQPGETVLDLGSGGGLDCFLAARQVGAAGRVIGVDMTPEMIARAREAAGRLALTNVSFRQGYLEDLPVDDESVDVVISNCVINLSPDKPQVFREIYRSLTPGGRVAISDIVTNGAMAESLSGDLDAWCACVAGAIQAREYQEALRAAGLVDVQIKPREASDGTLSLTPLGTPISALITARKPEHR